MKKLSVVITVFGLIFVSALSVLAANKPKSDAEINQLAAQGKNTLEAREWEVYVISTGKKAVTENDVFTFAEGKITSRNLYAQGYKRSNLNVGVQDDGTIIWETMQVNADNDLAFFRGELYGNSMRGVISMQPVKGVKTTLNFSTSMPQAAPVPVAEAQVQKKSGK